MVLVVVVLILLQIKSVSKYSYLVRCKLTEKGICPWTRHLTRDIVVKIIIVIITHRAGLRCCGVLAITLAVLLSLAFEPSNFTHKRHGEIDTGEVIFAVMSPIFLPMMSSCYRHCRKTDPSCTVMSDPRNRTTSTELSSAPLPIRPNHVITFTVCQEYAHRTCLLSIG